LASNTIKNVIKYDAGHWRRRLVSLLGLLLTSADLLGR
jgi:hypothetical protein